MPTLDGGLAGAIAVVAVGAVLGCATASLQGNPYRSPALVPLGLTGLTGIMAWTACRFDPAQGVPLLPCLLLGFLGGLSNTPLRSAYLAAVPADARGNGMAVMNALIYLLTIVLALLLVLAIRLGLLPKPSAQLLLLTGLAGLGTVLAWAYLFPRVVEQVTEWGLWPMYRIRIHGPGKDRLPLRGPLIVVANHASYLDPFWLGKVMPCHLRPLMTSVFYDRPLIRWLMVHVVQAIRVEGGYKRGRAAASEGEATQPEPARAVSPRPPEQAPPGAGCVASPSP